MGSYLAEVLPYWQVNVDRPDLAPLERYRAWYAFDQGATASRFGDLVETLLEVPTGARDIANTAATVIVLDQFTRKIFRGEARAYAGHESAAEIAGPLLQHGRETELPQGVRIALAMSLGNSERLAAHDQALAWLNAQQASASGSDLEELEEFTRIARQRREIIRLYGRFPPRNYVLGRANTPAEAYLLVGHGYEFE